MRKIFKLVAIAVGGVLIIAIAVMAYIAATFDPNQYRRQLIALVKDKTQRTLKLDGAVELSLFPNIAATLAKASLSEHASEEEFARADKVRIVLEPIPLLSEEIVVDSIEAENLTARIVRHKDGTLNIDDLIGAPERTPAPRVRIEIGKVRLTGATLRYVDQTSGANYAISGLELTTGPIANGAKSELEATFATQSGEPALRLMTKLKTGFVFDSNARTYSLKDTVLAVEGEALGMSDLSATLKGDLDSQGSPPSFTGSQWEATLTRKLQAGTLTVKGRVPQFTANTDQIQCDQVEVQIALALSDGNTTVAFEMPHIASDHRLLEVKQWNANVSVRDPDGTVTGKIQGQLTAQLETRKLDLGKWTAAINVNRPKLVKNPLAARIDGTAAADLVKHTTTVNFSSKIDDSTIRGTLGLAAFAPPLYVFDINVDQLDAERYRPEPDPKQKPFDLSTLNKFNARGSFKIGVLKLGDTTATNVQFDVKPDDNVMKADGKSISPAQPVR